MNQKLFLLLLICNAVNVARSDFELTIIHLNDIHSHFLEIKDDDHMCSPDDAKQGLCFGGIGRQVSMIKEIRKREKNVLVLSAGDFFMGTSYNPLHGFRLASIMLPYLGLNATALGNHAFDTGFRNAAAFILTSKCPVVCCNLIGRSGSFWEKFVNKSTVLNVGGEKVGIVGFIHPNTAKWARTGVSLHFVDELPCIREEVKKLQDLGVNKIVALGHSSFDVDKNIARNVSGIDVVVGGNSQVFLYNQDPNDGTIPHLLRPLGLYPKVLHQLPVGEMKTSSERSFLKTNFSLIVQVPQHGKYLGLLKVVFNDKGRIINFSGNPILLDKSVPKDAAVEEELTKSLKILEDPKRLKHIPPYNLVLGNSVVNLTGGLTCRMKECNLGNLVTDAAMFVLDQRAQSLDWPAPDAAVWNSGSLRASIPAGNITMRNLVHAIYMGDLMKVWKMKGEAIKKMMENSVAEYDPRGISPPGAFLQVSGMQVIYDLSRPPQERVVDIKLRCRSCPDTSLQSINEETVYKIAVPGYIQQGGDGFKKFGDDRLKEVLPDTEILKEYLQEFDSVNITTEKRITFKDVVKDQPPKFNIRSLNPFHQLSNREIFQETNSTDKHNSSKLGQNITSNLTNNKLVAPHLNNLTNTDAHNSSFLFQPTMENGNVATNENQKEENDEFGGNVLGWPIFEDHFDDNKVGDESSVVSDDFLANIFDDDIVSKEMVVLGNTTTETPGSKDPKNKTKPAFNDSVKTAPMQRSVRHKTIKKDLSSLQNNIYTVRDQMFQGWPDWIFNPEILKPTKPLLPSFENQSTSFNLATLDRLGMFHDGSLAIKNALKIKRSKPEPPHRSIVFPDTQKGSANNNTASEYLAGQIVPVSMKNGTNRNALPLSNSSVATTFAVTSHASNESELNEASTKKNMATSPNLELNREKKAKDDNNSWASTNLPDSVKISPQVVMLDNERHEIKNMASNSLSNTLENTEHDQHAEILHLANYSNLNENIILSQDSNINMAKVPFEEAGTSKPSIKIFQTEKKHELNALNEDKDFQSLTKKWNAENSHIVKEPNVLSSVFPNRDETSKSLEFNDDLKENVKQGIERNEASTKISFSAETTNSNEQGIFHMRDTQNVIHAKSSTRRPKSLNRKSKLNTARKNKEDLNKNKNKLNGTDHNVSSELANATGNLMTTNMFAGKMNTDIALPYTNIGNLKEQAEKSVESMSPKIHDLYEINSEPPNNSLSFHLTSKKPTKMENSAILAEAMLHSADPSNKHSENILMAPNNATISSENKLQHENNSLKSDMMPEIIYMSNTKPKIYPTQNLDYEKEHVEKIQPSLPQEITNFSEIKLRLEASEDVTPKRGESSVPLLLMEVSDQAKKHAEEIMMAVTHKNNDSSEIKSTHQNNFSAFDQVFANSSATGIVRSVSPKLMQKPTKKHAEKLLTSIPHKILKTSENKVQHENDTPTIPLELLQNVDHTEKHAEEKITSAPQEANIFSKLRKYNNDSSALNSISENIHVQKVKPSLVPRLIESLDYAKKQSEHERTPVQHRISNSSEDKLKSVSSSSELLSANVSATAVNSSIPPMLIFQGTLKISSDETLTSMPQNVNVSDTIIQGQNKGSISANSTKQMSRNASSYDNIFNVDFSINHIDEKAAVVDHSVDNSSESNLRSKNSSANDILVSKFSTNPIILPQNDSTVIGLKESIENNMVLPSRKKSDLQKSDNTLMSNVISQENSRESEGSNLSPEGQNIANNLSKKSINNADSQQTAGGANSSTNSSLSANDMIRASTTDVKNPAEKSTEDATSKDQALTADKNPGEKSAESATSKDQALTADKNPGEKSAESATSKDQALTADKNLGEKSAEDDTSKDQALTADKNPGEKSAEDDTSKDQALITDKNPGEKSAEDATSEDQALTVGKNLGEKSAEDTTSKDQALTVGKNLGEKSAADTTTKNHLQASLTDDQSPVQKSAVSAKPKKHYHRHRKVDSNPWDFFRLIFWKSF